MEAVDAIFGCVTQVQWLCVQPVKLPCGLVVLKNLLVLQVQEKVYPLRVIRADAAHPSGAGPKRTKTVAVLPYSSSSRGTIIA